MRFKKSILLTNLLNIYSLTKLVLILFLILFNCFYFANAQDANKDKDKNNDEEDAKEIVPPPKQLTCDFGSSTEINTCNFQFDDQLIHPNVKWKIGTGQNSFWLGGPRKDHTTMENTGGYLYFDTSYQLVNKIFSTASLESGERPSIKINNEEHHIPFNSRFNSSSFINNNINKFPSSSSSSFSAFNNHHSRSSKQFTPNQLIYEKKFMQELWHSNNNSPNSIQSKLHFNNNFFNSTNRHQNLNSNQTTIPFNVLTNNLNNNQINFQRQHNNSTIYKQPLVAVQDAIFTPPEPLVPNSGIIYSPNISETGPMGNCLRFYYNLNGLSADRIKVLVLDLETNTNQTLWQNSKTTNDEWIKAEISYAHDKMHKIVLEGVAKDYDSPERSYKGFVSVDDFSYGFLGDDSTKPGMCHGHCTFEGGLCGWTNLQEEDDFDWSQGRGSDSLYTGPQRDYFSFSKEYPRGGFLYIDASYPRRPGDRALLRSPQFPSPLVSESDQEKQENNGPICFKFATHMFGNGIGTLRVKVRSAEDGAPDTASGATPEEVSKNDKVLWEMSGESGNQWHQAQLSYASTTPYYFIFEGIVGPNYLGNIAIDNINIEQGACPISPQTASRKSGDCTFEESMCAWTNANQRLGLDHFDWSRQFSYGMFGPKTDHTRINANGYFMSLNGDNNLQRGGSYAWLISPHLQNSKQTNSLGKCMNFYYYIYQRPIEGGVPCLGGLRIIIRTFNNQGEVVYLPVWRLNNHQSMRWERAQVLIKNELFSTPLADSIYQVVVEGIWGDARVGSIAFDDVTFFDVAEDSNLCKTLPENAASVQGECHFDHNLCGWKNETLNIDNKSTNSKLDSLNNNRNNLIPHKISPTQGLIGVQQPTSSLLNNIHLFTRNQNIRPLVSWRLATTNSRPNNLQDNTFKAPIGYVYFDVFNQQYMQQPTLRSIKFPASTSDDQPKSKCLSFWFSAFGRGDNSVLSVYLMKLEETEESGGDSASGGASNTGSSPSTTDKKDDASATTNDEKSESNKVLLWTIQSSRLDTRNAVWYYGQTAINTEKDHHILFQGEATDGGFALDDITFYNGTCTTRPEVATVQKKEDQN